MQFQADIIDAPVKRPKCVETTAMGAAYLAGLAVGYWENKEDVLRNWSTDKIFKPVIQQNKREKMIRGWNKAVRCTFEWASDE